MAVREASRPVILTADRDRATDRAGLAAITLTAVAAFATVAAVIHAFVVPEHMMEAAEGAVPGWLPLAFAVTAGVGLVYALSLGWTAFQAGWLAVGIVLHGVMAAAGIISRTVGLPGAEVEGPTAVFLIAFTAELATVVLLAWLLLSPTPAIRPRLARRVGLTVGAVLVLAAVVSVLMLPDAIDHAKMLGAWLWGRPRPDAWLWGYANGSLRPDAWLWG